MHKLCLIYNTAPHYRAAVFRAIDAEYDCDWYFGYSKSDIKEMDTTFLNHVWKYKTWGNPSKLYWKRGIIKLLFKKKYDNFFMLAEARAISDYLFLFLASLFFPRKRIYIWTHGWYGKEKGLYAKIKLWQFKKSTGIFVYGDRAKRLLINKGIQKNKLFVIHNSLDYDAQVAIRENIHLTTIYKEYFKNEYPIIIFIGRLTKVKKLDMLIDALANLRKEGAFFNLVFVGDGVEAQNLKVKVTSLNLEKQVWFYGACYDEKINAELLYNADLCVSPGNVGLTAIHSLTFGCPVITHDSLEFQMPEYESIKPGLTGAFFKINDVESLTETIYQWFEKNIGKRDDVRKACFKEIETNWNPYFQINVIKNNIKLI